MRNKLMVSLLAIGLTGTVIHAEEMMKDPPPVQVTQVNVIQPNISPEMIRYAVTTERRAVFTAAMEDLLKDPAAKSNF